MSGKEGVGFSLALASLKCFSIVIDVITFPIYFLIQNPIGVKIRQNKERAEIVDQGEKYVTYKSKAKYSNTHVEIVKHEIDTMTKMMDFYGKKYSKKNCLGTRDILAEEDEVQPNGKVFKKLVLGDYKWRTFSDVHSTSKAFSKGLRELNVETGQNVVIFADTRAEWIIAAHALFRQSMPLVTIYATLGNEGIIHGINETESETIITTLELLVKFKDILSHTPRVKRIIYMEHQLYTFKDKDSYRADVEILPFQEVVQKGLTSNFEDVPPAPDDIAIIMYTSGSTGVPKGVLLQHKNLVATVKGFTDIVLDVRENEVMMGYLPLAHVFELLAESSLMAAGVACGYSGALTMLDNSSKIKQGGKGDATLLRPTITTGVPLILDRIAKGIQDKVAKGSFMTRLIFKFAYNYKVGWKRHGFSTPFIDRLVFGKVKRMLGGNLRLMVSGGAALTRETHEFVKNSICTTVLQGYGLTETTSAATCQDNEDKTYGRSGKPVTGSLIRLMDWEEGSYLVTDKPYPRGEIVVGGDSVSAGYYKQPEKTKEEFFEEKGVRWFRTGDIGEMHKDGVLKIIDRKKDLLKLQHGEYISLGKVESQLKTCGLIDNVCVYGESSKTYCMAIIAPNPVPLKALAEKVGVVNKSFKELCSDPSVQKAVLEEITAYAKTCKLDKFEIPSKIKVASEPWTPDSGLVTAAFKIKRKAIQEFYQNDIEKIYT